MKIVLPCSLDMKSPEFIEYKNEILALIPINSSEKAAQYREIWTRYHGIRLEVPPQN